MEPSPARESVELLTNHRGPASAAAWVSTHASEEVAAVALLLTSPAGAGITGTTINVDGGTSPY